MRVLLCFTLFYYVKEIICGHLWALRTGVTQAQAVPRDWIGHPAGHGFLPGLRKDLSGDAAVVPGA